MSHTEDHAARHKDGGGDPIKLDELAAPDNSSALNVSAAAHGLCPILPDDAGLVLNGKGLWTTPPGSLADYVQLQDQKTSGTDPGSFGSGTWRTRDLNARLYDPNGFSSLVANRFSLLKGLYYIVAHADAHQVSTNRLRIWSVTRGQLLIGMSACAVRKTVYDQHVNGSDQAIVAGQLEVTVSWEAFELQHRCTTSGYFGVASDW